MQQHQAISKVAAKQQKKQPQKEKHGDTQQKQHKLKFTYQEAKEYETIEADIELLEQRIAQYDTDMATNSTDFVKLNELSKAKEDLELQLTEKMERWEYLMEKAEQIECARKQPTCNQ